MNMIEDDGDEQLLNKYKVFVETEIELRCKEIISLLKDHLIKNVEGNGDEPEVFYLKMCSEYYKYLVEMDINNKDYKNLAIKYYEKVFEIAEKNLSPLHPTRLGVALNFSVYCYEILKESEKACEIAKKSFDSAVEKIDPLSGPSYKDSTVIMQRLRDNLILWTSSCMYVYLYLVVKYFVFL